MEYCEERTSFALRLRAIGVLVAVTTVGVLAIKVPEVLAEPQTGQWIYDCSGTERVILFDTADTPDPVGEGDRLQFQLAGPFDPDHRFGFPQPRRIVFPLPPELIRRPSPPWGRSATVCR